jgi:antitoxin VapB
MTKPSERPARELCAKIFRTGRRQAVRLPREVRFEEGQAEVRVRREGRRVILEPLDEWPDGFLAALGTCADFPEPLVRSPIRRARDRFTR